MRTDSRSRLDEPSDIGLNYLPPDINGLWVKHWTLVFLCSILFPTSQPDMQKVVCEENSQIQKTS